VQTIIQNMLGLASLEHQQQLNQVSSVNLNDLIQTQINHLNQKAYALKANIYKDCRADIFINADSFLLGQAIYNLLENALDFSPPNSEIKVTVTEEHHQIKIQIKDQGTGIPDYALTKVFDKFYSLPRTTTGNKSTGLGLNFVQEVVKLHGGSVSLSNHPDGGVLATLSVKQF
jgi:two-component system, OmpR family, sensor histidine kinase CreC